MSGDVGHHHDLAGRHLDLPETTRRAVVAIAALLAVCTVLGLVWLWPTGVGKERFQKEGYAPELVTGRVVEAREVPCPAPGGGPVSEAGFDSGAPLCGTFVIELLEGERTGERVTLEIYDTAIGSSLSVGERVVLSDTPGVPEQYRYNLADRERKGELLVLAVLFALAVVVFGRLRGLAALAGLVATVGLLLVFTLPAIIDGGNALAVALVSASAIAFVAIYLAHGVSVLTTVAVLGTLGALLVTAILATVFTHVARITGFAEEESAFLLVGGAEIEITGLILAGIIIGALGAIDDMTVTQVASVAELHAANPDYTMADLYRSANRIGQDHVASTVNTLVLAYAGASMPLLVLLAVTDQALPNVVNGELLATEIVRTLVGSIGLVTAVPLTTLLAAAVVRRAATHV